MDTTAASRASSADQGHRPSGARPSVTRAPAPNGNVAVNDDYRHRVVILDPHSGRIVWQYGHTDLGTAPGYLNTPDGMDFIPAGPGNVPLWAKVHHP